MRARTYKKGPSPRPGANIAPLHNPTGFFTSWGKTLQRNSLGLQWLLYILDAKIPVFKITRRKIVDFGIVLQIHRKRFSSDSADGGAGPIPIEPGDFIKLTRSKKLAKQLTV
jgi:hypothetical protein